jgi:hypothetical protein
MAKTSVPEDKTEHEVIRDALQDASVRLLQRCAAGQCAECCNCQQVCLCECIFSDCPYCNCYCHACAYPHDEKRCCRTAWFICVRNAAIDISRRIRRREERQVPASIINRVACCETSCRTCFCCHWGGCLLCLEVHDSVTALDEPHRIVITLRYFHEMKVHEIADKLARRVG